MNTWTDRVKNNPIWESIETALQVIKVASEKEGVTAESLDSLSRLISVVIFVKSRLSRADPQLIGHQLLMNLDASLKQITLYVQTFFVNGDVASLNTAQKNADDFLSIAANVVCLETREDFDSLGEAVAQYRECMQKSLDSVLSFQEKIHLESSGNQKLLRELSETVDSEKNRISALLSEQQSQFSSAQDKRSSDFSTVQADILSKNASQLSEQQSQFSRDQDSRNTNFSTFLQDGNEKVSMLMNLYSNKLKAQDEDFSEKQKGAQAVFDKNIKEIQDAYEKEAQSILADIHRQKKDVEGLVGVIGNLGVTSGYTNVANYAKKMVLVWQGATILSLAGLIFVAAMMVFYSGSGAVHAPLNSPTAQTVSDKNIVDKKMESGYVLKDTESIFLQGFMVRVFLSITFGIFATYSARQASKFFEMEGRNRKLALELEALGPFIEPLDKSDRDKFRIQVGDRSFGGGDVNPASSKSDDPVTVLDILKSKEFLNELSSLFKKFQVEDKGGK